jgi:hypothetical protein
LARCPRASRSAGPSDDLAAIVLHRLAVHLADPLDGLLGVAVPLDPAFLDADVIGLFPPAHEGGLQVDDVVGPDRTQ